jgi:hypothetical protein
MYALYQRTRIGNAATRYERDKKEPSISLFGCNNGFIPWLLSLKIPASQKEPYCWHVDVLAELNAQPDYRCGTLIIDLKPKQNKTNISLYEVMDVWGWSEHDWTPILLRLDGLFVDGNPEEIDRENFVRDDADIDGPIYEFLYLVGSVNNGKLNGLWVPPPASPTNAALLWPETLNYFFRCIRERTPDVLDLHQIPRRELDQGDDAIHCLT